MSARGCPACGHEAVQGARFCARCGAALIERCAGCQAELARSDRFCPQCGLTVEKAPEQGADQVGPRLDAERRQLTVVFCDLIGSTEISAGMDPEEYSDFIRSYHGRAGEVTRQYGGRVHQYLGDGVVIGFGWPEAHGDDAERAVRAALAIVDEVAAPADTARGRPAVTVRIAVHTGPVVIGGMTAGDAADPVALGETLNVAARLQEVAHRNTVVISRTTLELVSGLFLIEELGPQRLKGVPEPVLAYQAVQASGVRSRLDAARGALTPLVGREADLGFLTAKWRRAQSGCGEAVLITGQPGIGKSRLAYELRRSLEETPHSWLETRCSSYTRTSVLQPAIELVEAGLQLQPHEPEARRLEKLQRGLDGAGVSSSDAVPLMAHLLATPPPENVPALQMSPERRRERTIEVLTDWVLGLTRLQPMVLVVEDLHWCDPSSLDLFERLILRAHTTHLLLLATARDDFIPSGAGRRRLSTLTLGPLEDHDVKAMVTGLAGNRALPDEVFGRITAAAGGMPLYAEEFGRMVLDSNVLLEREGRWHLAATDGGHLDIPSTLHGSLMARLDRLGAGKWVAQVAAVVGSEFDYTLLSDVADIDEASLRAGLDRLIEHDLIFITGITRNATSQLSASLCPPPDPHRAWAGVFWDGSMFIASQGRRRRSIPRRMSSPPTFAWVGEPTIHGGHDSRWSKHRRDTRLRAAGGPRRHTRRFHRGWAGRTRR